MRALSNFVFSACLATAMLNTGAAAAEKQDAVVAAAPNPSQIQAVKVQVRLSGSASGGANHGQAIRNEAEASSQPATGTLITMIATLVLMIVIALRRKRS